MLGSLGWRSFFAAMLPLGAFAVLMPERDNAPYGPQYEVTAGVEIPSLLGTNKIVQVDTLAPFKSYAESVDFAIVGQAAAEKATIAPDITEVARYRILYNITDRDAAISYRQAESEGRANAYYAVPWLVRRLLS